MGHTEILDSRKDLLISDGKALEITGRMWLKCDVATMQMIAAEKFKAL